MVTAGAGNSRVFELRAPMMVKGRSRRRHHEDRDLAEDMQVIRRLAKKIGAPVPLFAATRPVYQAALAGGHAMHDTAAVCAVLEKKARVRSESQTWLMGMA